MEQGTKTLQLSNGLDKPPIVHCQFVPSTSTWQYIVADPTTRRCVVIDPARDHSDDERAMVTLAADAIITLVKQHGYIVEQILETSSAIDSKYRPATWFLRMQLADSQDHPPVVSSAPSIASMTSSWQRRHGNGFKFATNLGASMADGDTLSIGRMRIQCLRLPSYGTAQRTAFVIGSNVFGGHSLATLSRASKLFTYDGSTTGMDLETARETWFSMQKVLSFSEDAKLYLDLGDSAGPETEDRPFELVQFARDVNEYESLSAAEFFTRWQGQQQEYRNQSRKDRKKQSKRSSRS